MAEQVVVVLSVTGYLPFPAADLRQLPEAFNDSPWQPIAA